MANNFQRRQACAKHLLEEEQEAIIHKGLGLFSVHFRSLWS